MISQISAILAGFRACFSRKAAFHWFVVVVFGFIVRLDHCGVSSFVRWLEIKPELHTALVSHFRAKSWRLVAIVQCWWQILLQHCPLSLIDGRLVIAGDGIKISKEAEKMPAIKRLHQESENSGKAPFIYGHHWGLIGIMAGWVKKTVLHSPLCRAP